MVSRQAQGEIWLARSHSGSTLKASARHGLKRYGLIHLLGLKCFFKTFLERLLTTTVLCWFSCHETKVAVRMQKILSCDSVSGKVVFLLLCFNQGIFSFEGTSLLGKGKKALREDFVVMTVMQISPLERKKTDFYFCK